MRFPILFQNVLHLMDLVLKLCPLLRVVGNKGALPGFLRDNYKGTYLGIGSTLVVPEIALRQKLRTLFDVVVEFLTAKDVLFLQGIAFSERLEDMIQHVHEGIVLVGIGTVLLHRVLYLEDGAVVTCPIIQHGIDQPALGIGNILYPRKESVQCVFPNAHTSDDSV